MIFNYPGGPAFNIPTPPGFPAYIGPNDLLYHNYDVSVSENCSDSNMMQGLINSQAPGNPMSPATAGGTPNVAQALGVDNSILSYVTNDLVTGNPIVVNVTTGSQLVLIDRGPVARGLEGCSQPMSFPQCCLRYSPTRPIHQSMTSATCLFCYSLA